MAQILKENPGSKTTWDKVRDLTTRMGWKLYQRGQAWGLIVEDRKYRLKTLGIEVETDPRVLELANFAKARLRDFETRPQGGRSHADEEEDLIR